MAIAAVAATIISFFIVLFVPFVSLRFGSFLAIPPPGHPQLIHSFRRYLADPLSLLDPREHGRRTSSAIQLTSTV
jgi:hypothetical protein